MLNTKKVLPTFIVFVFAVISIVSVSKTASANACPLSGSWGLIESACPLRSGQYQELVQLKNEIAASNSIDKARAMALAPTDRAINALKNASAIVPFSSDLRAAENRLSDIRSRILVASSQDQIANEFSGMMLAGLDDDSVARVNVGKVGCNYSTGEVIAIVVGLILGIIPGLILLVVLC